MHSLPKLRKNEIFDRLKSRAGPKRIGRVSLSLFTTCVDRFTNKSGDSKEFMLSFGGDVRGGVTVLLDCSTSGGRRGMTHAQAFFRRKTNECDLDLRLKKNE